jgi:hypothetical protein
MNRIRLALAAALLCACGGDSVEPLALSITLTATPASAAVGDTVTFVADAQGNALTALSADYGDGTSDGFQIPFARTARNSFKHVYATAGTFTATASVAQADSTTKSATATVQVH